MAKNKQLLNSFTSEINAVSNEYSSPIRIFVVSAPEDFALERCHLFEKIYTSVKRKYDDIIFIDKHPVVIQQNDYKQKIDDGITEFDFNYSNEVLNSYFLVLIGNKRGNKQFKQLIVKEEFELLLTLTEQIELSYAATDNLLKYFYELDDNYIAKKFYKLKSFESIQASLGLTSDDEQFKWKVLKQQIMDVMCEAADACYQNGELSEEERNKYYITDFEEDIMRIILKNPLVSKNIFVLFRNDKEHLNSSTNGLNGGSDENDEKYLLETLKEKLRQGIPIERQFSIEVDKDCLTEAKIDSTETKEYLLKYENIILQSFDQLFIDRLNATLNSNDPAYIHAKEILHHERYCNRILKDYFQRDEYTVKLREYLNERDNLHPFLIDGDQGSGKTCIIASLAKSLRYESEFNILIYRFVGTSQASSNLVQLFKSIIYELTKRLNLTVDESVSSSNNIISLREQLLKLLRKSAERHSVKKYFILLDSIDQLCLQDANLNFLIKNLPQNTKIIYTVNTETVQMTESIKSQLTNSFKNYFKLESFDIETSKEILLNWIFKFQRRLVDTQIKEIENCLQKTRFIYPFHLKLLFNECVYWHSLHKPEIEFRYCLSSKDTIKYLIEKLEKFYGKILISRVIFYLMIFKNGISESELDDLLSIDDYVMYECMCLNKRLYKRFPMYLWLQIKYELRDFLMEKEFNNMILITWNHKLFRETCERLYADLFKQSETRDKCLNNLIDYFTGKWTTQPKPYEIKTSLDDLNENDINLIHLRLTKNQDIQNEYLINNNQIKHYNSRKLNELLNVILMFNDDVKKIQYLKELIYLNYEFIYAKSELKTLNFTFDIHKDLQDMLKTSTASKLPAHILDELKELLVISKIYTDKLDKIEANPDCLGLHVFNGVKNQSTDTWTQFEYESLKNCSLMPIQQYQTNNDELVKLAFKTQLHSKIAKIFYNNFDFNFAFILNEIDDGGHFILSICNVQSCQLVGTLTISTDCQMLSPYLLRKPTLNINKLKHLQGGLLYANLSTNTIYRLSFDETSVKLRTFDSKICAMKLISTQHLLVQFQTAIIIVQIEQCRVLYRKDFDCAIRLLNLNQEQTMVYIPDFDYIDSIIVVVDEQNTITLFNFVKQTQKFEQLTEISVSFQITQCLIDRIFFVENQTNSRNNLSENFKDMTVFVRLAVWDSLNCVLQVINVYISDFDYDAITSEFEKNNEFILNEFCDNLILLSSNNLHFIFDIEKGKVFEACYTLNGTNGIYKKCSILNKTKILTQTKTNIELHEINHYEATDKMIKSVLLSRIDFSSNDFFIKNEKCVLCLNSDCTKLIKFNPFDVPIEISNNSRGAITNILHIIDNDHVLIQIKARNPYYNGEIVVYNIASQQFKGRLYLKNYIVFGSNSKYLVLTNESSILIYYIKNDNVSFTFKKLKRIQLNYTIHEDANLNKCFLTDNQRTIIILYNQQTDTLTMYKLQYNETEPSARDAVQLKIFPIELQLFNYETRELVCLVTSLDNYIFLSNGNLLYCIDIEESVVLTETQLNLSLYSFQSIKNSNDCLAFHHDFQLNKTRFIYIQIEIENSFCDFKITEKLYDLIVDDMKIIDSYLFIKTNETECKLDIYDLNELKQSKKFKLVYQLVFKDDFVDICLSIDLGYLSVFNTNRCVHLIRLSDYKRIAFVQFDKMILSFSLNDKYLSVLTEDEQFLSYLIVDLDNAMHLDRIKDIESDRNRLSESNQVVAVDPEYLNSEAFNVTLFNLNQLIQEQRLNNFDDEEIQLLRHLSERTREMYFMGEEEAAQYASFDGSSSINDDDEMKSMLSMCPDPEETHDPIELVELHFKQGSFISKSKEFLDIDALKNSGTDDDEDDAGDDDDDQDKYIVEEVSEIVKSEEDIHQLRDDDTKDQLDRTFINDEETEEEANGVVVEQEEEQVSNECEKKDDDESNETEEESAENEDYNEDEGDEMDGSDEIDDDKLEQVQISEIEDDEEDDEVDKEEVDELQPEELHVEEVEIVEYIIEENKLIKREEEEVEDEERVDEFVEAQNETPTIESESVEIHENGIVTEETYLENGDETEKSIQNGRDDYSSYDNDSDSDSEGTVIHSHHTNSYLSTDSFESIHDGQYINDDQETDVELPESLINTSNLELYWSYDSSCILIGSTNTHTNEKEIYTMNIVNNNNLKLINVIKLPKNTTTNMILPCIYGIICESDRILYKIEFDNSFIVLKKYTDEINEIFLLSTTHILLQFKNKIEIFDFVKNQSFDKTYSNTSIKRILTNIPKKTVFSPEFDLVDTYVVIVFDDNSIQILKFLKDNQTVMLIAEMCVVDCIDDCLLDGSFFVDHILNSNQIYSIKNNLILLRFAIWNRDKYLLRILNLKKDKDCEVLIDTNLFQFNNELFYRQWESGLEDFFNDRILLSADGGTFMLYIDKRILIDMSKMLSSMGYNTKIIDEKKLITQRYDKIEIHEIYRLDDEADGGAETPFLRSVILFNVNIHIKNLKLNGTTLINHQGDGCRLTKLKYFLDCLKKHKSHILPQTATTTTTIKDVFRRQRFNKDLFNFNKEYLVRIGCKQNYIDILQSYQKNIQRLPIFDIFENKE